MRKFGMILVLLAVLTPGFVFSDLVTFKLGYFFPRAKSDLWVTEFDNLTLKRSDYTGSIFGFSYEYFVTREIAVQLSVDGYSKQKSGAYLDYEGLTDYDGDWAYPAGVLSQADIAVGGFVPQHVYSVSVTPIQVSLKFTPLGRGQRIIPYLGGGVGLYIWGARLQGDVIDFADPWIDTERNDSITYPVDTYDIREESKLRIGFQVLGGIMFPLANRISLEGEFKYNFAHGTLDDFVGFEPFDLNGFQVSLAMNYWF
jgi:opacity protein-like surface antigen